MKCKKLPTPKDHTFRVLIWTSLSSGFLPLCLTEFRVFVLELIQSTNSLMYIRMNSFEKKMLKQLPDNWPRLPSFN